MASATERLLSPSNCLPESRWLGTISLPFWLPHTTTSSRLTTLSVSADCRAVATAHANKHNTAENIRLPRFKDKISFIFFCLL